MRLVFDKRDEFVQLLLLRFTTFCPTVHLKIYGIPKQSLKEYKSNNTKRMTNNKYMFDNEPPDKYRLRGEEIQTQEEVEQEAVDDDV